MNLLPKIRRTTMKTTNLADLYALPIIDWSLIEDRLALGVSQAPGTGGPDRHASWLAMINRDGSPHVTGGVHLVRRLLLVRDRRTDP